MFRPKDLSSVSVGLTWHWYVGVTKTRPTDGSPTEGSAETPGSLIHRIVARPSFDGSFIVTRNVTNPLDAKWRTN